MTDKALLSIACSQEFKDAVGLYATSNNTDVSKIIRKAVAEVIGYDLSKDEVHLGRKTKYGSDEERKEAHSKAVRSKREFEKLLVEIYDHTKHLDDVEELKASLIARGVDLNGI